MAQIVTITNPLTGQPAQVDQLEHTAQEIDDAIARALPGGAIDTALQNKAPAGYGLGSAFNSVSDANTIVAFGCYSTKVNTPTGDWCTILHIPYGENNATQYAKIGEGYDYQRKCAAKRDKIKGTWQPWEWVNPPMLLGDEYRTTWRYQGKPVYVKAVDCGAMPNKTTKQIEHGVSGCQPFCAYGYAKSGSNYYTLPLLDVIYINANHTKIQIKTTGDYSAWTGIITIKYTKTTD